MQVILQDTSLSLMAELLKELGEEDLFEAESELLLIVVVGFGTVFR